MRAPVIRHNVDLQPYNTLRVKATAERFTRISQAGQLTLMSPESLKDVCVLGGGSNMLFQDRISSLVIKNEIRYLKVIEETPKEIVMEAGAGVNWHELVTRSVGNQLGGIENLALIPGTVGAAPIQNIGAYGAELSDVFLSLEAFDLEDRKMKIFGRDECRFGYRDSIFKKEYKGRFIITSVRIRMSKPPHAIKSGYRSLREWLDSHNIGQPTVRDIYNGVVEIRKEKLPDPSDLGNAGSFFKNPVIPLPRLEKLKLLHPDIPFYPAEEEHVKIPAGWLIEKSGWKGKRRGNVGTYTNQALVIVNHGGATGAEIRLFATGIQESVEEEFGIALVPEVNMVGLPDE